MLPLHYDVIPSLLDKWGDAPAQGGQQVQGIAVATPPAPAHPASAVFRSGHAVGEAALTESVFRVSDRAVRAVVIVMDHDTEAVVEVLPKMASAGRRKQSLTS